MSDYITDPRLLASDKLGSSFDKAKWAFGCPDPIYRVSARNPLAETCGFCNQSLPESEFSICRRCKERIRRRDERLRLWLEARKPENDEGAD